MLDKKDALTTGASDSFFYPLETLQVQQKKTQSVAVIYFVTFWANLNWFDNVESNLMKSHKRKKYAKLEQSTFDKMNEFCGCTSNE